MTTLHTCATLNETLLGGLGIRPVGLPRAGDFVDGHEHHFDHVMFFATGRVRVEANGATHIVEPGTYLLIEAAVRHAITALTDDVKFWCVFPEHDANGHRGPMFMADKVRA
jgi:glyoxylate utilization-related uncharacterized protein